MKLTRPCNVPRRRRSAMSSCAGATGTVWRSPPENSYWLVERHHSHCLLPKKPWRKRKPPVRASTVSWHMTWQVVPWWSCNERKKPSLVSNRREQKRSCWGIPPVTGACWSTLLIFWNRGSSLSKQLPPSLTRKPVCKRLRLDCTAPSYAPPSSPVLPLWHYLLLQCRSTESASQKRSSRRSGWRV